MQQQKLKEETLYTKKKHISFDCFSETDTNSAVFQIDFFSLWMESLHIWSIFSNSTLLQGKEYQKIE